MGKDWIAYGGFRAELLFVDLSLQACRLLQVRVDDADVLLPIDEIVRQKKTQC
jgi:hypothetical protein